jgi:hypothetical protein
MKNIITGLTDADVAMLHQAIDMMDGLIEPFSISLDEAQRSATPALGDRRTAFTYRAFNFAGEYPNLLEGARSYTEFKRIHFDWVELSAVFSRLSIVHKKLDDTTLRIGANLHSYANTFYDRAKEALEDERPGIALVVEKLSVQYEAQRNRGNTKDELPKGDDGGVVNIPGNIKDLGDGNAA